MPQPHDSIAMRTPASIGLSWESLSNIAWRRDATCSEDFDFDMWFSAQNDLRATAAHICLTHCPVLAKCRDWGQSLIPEQRITQVIGGIRYNKNGHVSRSQSIAATCDICKENRYKIS